MKIMLTRPLDRSHETEAKLRILDHDVLVEPLLEIDALESKIPEGSYSGIILTSAHAAPALDEHWTAPRDAPVFTTGVATSKAARDTGFSNVHTIEGSAAHLVEEIPKHIDAKNQHLLYPCAEITAHDLPKLLAAKNIQCTPWPAYAAHPAEHFSPTARKALASGSVDAVLLYSARTAECYARLVNTENVDSPAIFALSEQVACALPEPLRQRSVFPKQPTEEKLFALLAGCD